MWNTATTLQHLLFGERRARLRGGMPKEQGRMRTFTGKVENGSVRLPRSARLRDGTRVIVAVMPGVRRGRTLAVYPPELEAEDARFVQACRGRLVRQLREEEG